MFNKLKNKLKEWTTKVSKIEDTLENKNLEYTERQKIQEKSKEKMLQKTVIRNTPKGKKKNKKSKKKEITSKEFEKMSEKEVDKKIQKELETEKYIEPKNEFNIGLQKVEPKIEQKPFLKKLISKEKIISQKKFEEYSEELEMILLENNVAIKVSEKIINELKKKIIGKPMNKKQIEETLSNTLKNIIENILVKPFNIIEEIKEKKSPYIILFCGINGTGKTTHVAKIANMLKKRKFSCVLAAGDTFRAAAVEQLKEHGKKLDIKVISQDYGADPAAVGFDAIKYAKKNKTDVVLIDTAGRIHTAVNLIREMAKIKKICNPDRTIFVGESITGNDATDQVKAFNDNIGIDGIILSKADIDEKGGTALSVGYTTKKPILFLGTGQEYKDIEPFDKEKFIEKLGL
ncbi:MAG: signal recognition particle-docking protein FtsY [Nanoarchaeota archaeon]|nr:signal recognition particle-docking protein FtsY [Nanoarchaeota archaeon]